MSNKIIIAIIGILVVSVGWFFVYNSLKWKNDSWGTDNWKESGSIWMKLDGWEWDSLESIVNTRDPLEVYCEVFDWTREECEIDYKIMQAQNAWDPDMCDEIQDENSIIDCKKKVIISLVFDSEDATKCDQLSEFGSWVVKDCMMNYYVTDYNTINNYMSIDDCIDQWNSQELCDQLVNYWIKPVDQSKCFEIEDDDLRLECFDKIKYEYSQKIWDVNFCLDVWNLELKNQCQDNIFLNNALISWNIQMCGNIRDYELLNECRDSILLTKAIQLKNIDLCSKSSNEDSFSECQDAVKSSIFSQIISNHFSVDNCLWITDETEYQECFSEHETVLTNFEESWCKDYKEDYLKIECIDRLKYEYSIRYGDYKKCLRITNDELQKKCVDDSVVENVMNSWDKYLCNLVNDESTKSDCESFPVFDNKGEDTEWEIKEWDFSKEICDNMSDEESKTYCMDNVYLKEAITNSDIKICQKIQSEIMSSDCIGLLKDK